VRPIGLRERLPVAKGGESDLQQPFGFFLFGADLARSMNKIEDAKVVAVFDPNHGEEVAQELGSDVCASFQRAVFDVLIYKTEKLMKEKNLDTLVVSGGVSANNTLREEINKMCESNNFKSYFPDKVLCTDNAAMIASSGYYEYIFGVRSDLTLNVEPNLEL